MHPVTATLIAEAKATAVRGIGTGRPRLNPSRLEMTILRQMRLDGASVRACAKKLGYAVEVVNRWMRDVGMPTDPAPHSLPEKQRETIIAARADGWSIHEIAREMGIKPSRVQRFCATQRVPFKARRWRYGGTV